MERFKYVSMLSEVEGVFGAVRPASNRGEDWGMKDLADERYAEYCAINANTGAGLEQVTKYNN